MTILDQLSRKFKLQRGVVNVLGVGLAVALACIPAAYTWHHVFEHSKKSRRSDTTQRLVSKCNDDSSVKNVLAPYLRDNPMEVEVIDENYDNLRKLATILPREDQKAQAPLEQKVNVAGYRLDIGTNHYFSETPLSGDVKHFPEIKLAFDPEKKALYSLSDADQRLANPIMSVQSFLRGGNNFYMCQESNLFLRSSGKFVKEDDKKHGIREIEGTRLVLDFMDKEHRVLGASSQEDRALKGKVEERLSNITNLNLPGVDRASYADNVLCVFNPVQLIAEFPDKKKSIDIRPTDDKTKFLDYVVLDEPRDFEDRSNKPLQKVFGLFQETKITRAISYEMKYSFRVVQRDKDYTIPAPSLNADYRFPKNSREKDLVWLRPNYLKFKVREELSHQTARSGRKD